MTKTLSVGDLIYDRQRPTKSLLVIAMKINTENDWIIHYLVCGSCTKIGIDRFSSREDWQRFWQKYCYVQFWSK